MLISEIKSQATFVLECQHCSPTEREHKDLGDECRIQMWKPTTTLIYNAQANPQRVTYSSSVYYPTDQKPPAGYLMQNTLCLSLPTCLCQHICQHCNTVKKTVTYTMLFHQAPDKVVAKNAIQEPFNTICCGVCLNWNSNPGHLLVLIRGQHETWHQYKERSILQFSTWEINITDITYNIWNIPRPTQYSSTCRESRSGVVVTRRKSIPSSDTFTTFSIHAISKLRLPSAARKSLGETENNPLAERSGKTGIPARAWKWPPTLFLQEQQKRQYRQHSSARSRRMAEKNSKQTVSDMY